MFKVFMKRKGEQPPAETTHYIIAKNGIFLKKGSWWMDAVVPVKQIAVLERQEISLRLKIKPISAVVLTKAWKFFRAVYKKQFTEAAVLLHYSEQLGWELTVPKQKATGAHVDYEMTDRLPGYVFMGTMHSHARMSAFHSSTDIHDEAEVDGIHITFGDLDEDSKFSLDPETVVNGTRFALNLSHLEGLVEWGKNPAVKVVYVTTKPRYTIECPEMSNWVVPDGWVAKVEHPSYLTDFLKGPSASVPFVPPLPQWDNGIPAFVDENPAAGSVGLNPALAVALAQKGP